MPSAVASTDNVNSSRDPIRATCSSTQGTTRLPTIRTSARNKATLASVTVERQDKAVAPDMPRRVAGVIAQHTSQGWQENKSQHHGKILDDQPADGDAAVDRVEGIALLKSAQQNDRAGDRERQAEHQASA